MLRAFLALSSQLGVVSSEGVCMPSLRKIILGCIAAAAMPLAATASTFSVYVGYADGLRSGPDFPVPFAVGGSFGPYTVGSYLGNTSGLDSGAVMIVNTGLSAFTVNNLSINDRANGATYAIWTGNGSKQLGTGISLGVGQAMILLENAGNNFDSSDFGNNTNPQQYAGFNANNNNCSTGPIALQASCLNNSPIVTFTLDTLVQANLFDTGHVLDTGGFDSAAYLHHHSDGTDSFNESLQWRLIGTSGINNPGGGTVPEPFSLALVGTALAGVVLTRRRKAAES